MNYLRTEAENDPPTHPKTLTPQANCATYPSPMSGPLDTGADGWRDRSRHRHCHLPDGLRVLPHLGRPQDTPAGAAVVRPRHPMASRHRGLSDHRTDRVRDARHRSQRSLGADYQWASRAPRPAPLRQDRLRNQNLDPPGGPPMTLGQQPVRRHFHSVADRGACVTPRPERLSSATIHKQSPGPSALGLPDGRLQTS